MSLHTRLAMGPSLPCSFPLGPAHLSSLHQGHFYCVASGSNGGGGREHLFLSRLPHGRGMAGPALLSLHPWGQLMCDPNHASLPPGPDLLCCSDKVHGHLSQVLKLVRVRSNFPEFRIPGGAFPLARSGRDHGGGQHHLCIHGAPWQMSGRVSSPILMSVGLAHLHPCHQGQVRGGAISPECCIQ